MLFQLGQELQCKNISQIVEISGSTKSEGNTEKNPEEMNSDTEK